MMNPEIKAEWLTALRSGAYKQCKGALNRNDGYCCLGVLADVIDKKDIRPIWHWGRTRDHDGDRSFGSSVTNLPDNLAEYLGMTIMERSTLVDLNDKYEQTFDEIAKYIETRL